MSAALFAAEGAASEATFPILTALVVIPAVGAAIAALLPRNRPETVRQVAALISGLAGILSVWLLVNFDRADDGFQFVERQSWIEDLGISWHLGVDGISLFLVVLSGLLFPLAIVAVTPERDAKPYYAWLLLLQAGCLGVFVALDLFAFFVFFEVVLVPMYFLIAGWGHGNSSSVALKFFLYTMAGSALMLVGILALVFLSRGPGDPISFDLVQLAEAPAKALSPVTARWIFLSFALAFAIKVPLVPVHTWLPDAHTEAPTAGSVILAGVMLKLGTYGFVRFGLYLFPEATSYFAPLFLTLGVIGIIYGAIAATMQRDLKRLVAYSSVAHLGFIVLGTFALNRQGLTGGLLQMVNHGLSTGALFLLVGMIYERRHTREIAALSGLQKAAPILAGVFTLVMLSSVGLPGLNGFTGEFLVLLGAFANARWWAVVAAAGVIIAALYLLWAYQRVFHGTPDRPENENLAEMTWREGLSIAPLLVGIVFLGVYPKPMIERIEPAVERLVAHMETRTGDVAAEPEESERRGEAELIEAAEKAEAKVAAEHGEAGGADGDHSGEATDETGEGE